MAIGKKKRPSTPTKPKNAKYGNLERGDIIRVAPYFVAGISDGAIGGAHALTMLGNAEQNGLFWGFFGHFEPLLSEMFKTS